MPSGLGNYLQSEAIKGACPRNQNSPQKPPFGLYPEQLSGSAFTQTRIENLRSWLYRILPSVKHSEPEKKNFPNFLTSPLDTETPPTQMRWNPPENTKKQQDFIEGLQTYVANGSPESMAGIAAHLYVATKSMDKTHFMNSDGHMLIVPQHGSLHVWTEFGRLSVEPSEIVVVPKGIKFRVDIEGDLAIGYVCENYGFPFVLPDLGPIGSNGLADPRHFEAPQAEYFDESGDFELIHKYCGGFWSLGLDYNPLNVVGWNGNYYPYKYDLKLFNVINTVSFDHPDPSIFTVLTSPSGHPGLANCDFVIFPPRWMVAEHTFRPPYYHRNIMSEFMGLISGQYDAKEEGFLPGGASLHNCFSAHGPDKDAFNKGTNANLTPEKYENTLAFMFETRLPFSVSEFALKGALRQTDYVDCWQSLESHFEKKNN